MILIYTRNKIPAKPMPGIFLRFKRWGLSHLLRGLPAQIPSSERSDVYDLYACGPSVFLHDIPFLALP